jgi:lipopolysaccharide transport system ATP-binding protein
MSSEADIVITVRDLGKRYEIYDKPRDRLLQMLARGRRRYFREFWALKDISFDMRRGETVGIIGRNGSGKSTLLQLICGTLSPTKGTVEVNGRVAALLELGAGFNPEFTGRENVMLSGKLLGLTQQEIVDRFDQIAAFADIGDFMNQPVKTYSSGMYVRLAFAVVAHVDADMLIVDEALAVGDAVFTQKCMRFIRRFQENGTLIFVSHDMGAIQNLCRKVLWIGEGQVRQLGPAKQVVESYLKYTLQQTYGDEVKLASAEGVEAGDQAENELVTAPLIDYGPSFTVHDNIGQARGWRTGHAEITSMSITRADGRTDTAFEGGERVCVTLRAKAHTAMSSPILGFVVRDRLGQDLFGENTLAFTNLAPRSVPAGQSFEGKFIFRLPMLANGDYAMMASVADGHQFDNTQHHYMHDALVLSVASSKMRFGIMGLQFEQVSLDVVGAVGSQAKEAERESK